MDTALQHPLWTYDTLSAADVAGLLAAARARRSARDAPLRGKHVALVSDTPQSASSRAFAEAVAALGGRLSVLRAQDLRLDEAGGGGHAARMLGRLYDAVGAETGDPLALARLARDAGIPVLRLATSAVDPTRLVADLMAMQDALPGANRPPRLCVRDVEGGERLAAWRRVAAAGGLQVCSCEAAADARPTHEVDFVSEPAAPPCSDGHPSLRPTRPGLDLAPAQVANHRLVLEALLTRLLP